MERLPSLPWASWQKTLATLHRQTQILGKIRLELTPRQNHFWNVALEVRPSGLSTGSMPWGRELFEIDLDFLAHELRVRTSRGEVRELPLQPRSVKSFYDELFRMLADLGIEVSVNPRPQEIAEDALPLDEDELHASYDPEAAAAWHRILLFCKPVFERFRAKFHGKASPVCFYWGSFDLSFSLHSGRSAPPREGVISSEAYSEELFTAGVWPGDARLGSPHFFAYTAPAPEGYREADLEPTEAFYDDRLGEFLLSWDAVRADPDPEGALLAFIRSAYGAGAGLARWEPSLLRWDSSESEREDGFEPVPLH